MSVCLYPAFPSPLQCSGRRNAAGAWVEALEHSVGEALESISPGAGERIDLDSQAQEARVAAASGRRGWVCSSLILERDVDARGLVPPRGGEGKLEERVGAEQG